MVYVHWFDLFLAIVNAGPVVAWATRGVCGDSIAVDVCQRITVCPLGYAFKNFLARNTEMKVIVIAETNIRLPMPDSKVGLPRTGDIQRVAGEHYASGSASAPDPDLG